MPEETKFLMFGKSRIGLSRELSRKFFSAEKPFHDERRKAEQDALAGKPARPLGKPLSAFSEPARIELENGLKAILSDRLRPREQRVEECLGKFFQREYHAHIGLRSALAEAARRIEEDEQSFLIKHDGSTENPVWAWHRSQELRTKSGVVLDF